MAHHRTGRRQPAMPAWTYRTYDHLRAVEQTLRALRSDAGEAAGLAMDAGRVDVVTKLQDLEARLQAPDLLADIDALLAEAADRWRADGSGSEAAPG